MESPPTWELVLLGATAVLLILWLRPGIKSAFERSRRAEAKDWQSVLLPLGAVVAFVLLLLWLA